MSELMISFDANSNNREELASFKACLLALLNEAAVPVGDFGSTPPSTIYGHIIFRFYCKSYY